MKTIVLISCVSQKLMCSARAADLYTSTLFKLNLRYAEILDPDETYILSAKYGLLSLDDVIEPYDKTLNEMGTAAVKLWASMVLEQLAKKSDLVNDHFIFLAGNNYRKFVLPSLMSYDVPLVGLRIGEQLKRLKELTA